MRHLLAWIVLLTSSFVRADLDQGPCAIELGFGTQNIEIMTPDFTKAVYEGYAGMLTGSYAMVATENFHLGARISFGYSELNNKANTDSLREDIRHFSAAPGLELKVHSVVVGAEYQYNKETLGISGSLEGKVHTSFYTPNLFVGIDIPLGGWGLRFYYMRSGGDIPHLDTGLSEDSPWSQEQFMISLRFNPRYKKSDRFDYLSNDSDVKSNSPTESPSDSSGTSSGRSYRPLRYNPRPSARINY